MKKIIILLILLITTSYAYADEVVSSTTGPKEISIDAQYSPYNQNEYGINDFNTPYLYSKGESVIINIKAEKKIKQILTFPGYERLNSIKTIKNKITITSKSNEPAHRMLQFRIEYEDDRYSANKLFIYFIPDTYSQDNPNDTTYKYQGSPKIININLTNTSKSKSTEEIPSVNFNL